MIRTSPVAKIAESTVSLDTVVAAFEWLSAGFLICDASGRLVFANEYGGRILESRDGLGLDEDGRVTMRVVDSSLPTSSAMDFRAALTAASKRKGLIVFLARPSGRLPLTLILRPAGIPRTTGPENARSNADTGPMLVLLHEPDLPGDAALTVLRELLSLTLTEARLAHLLMQGKTTEDCIHLLGIRRTTIKMHLCNLYGKTGVQRQGELVSLLFKSFGNLRCPGNSQAGSGRYSPCAERGLGGDIGNAERAAC